MRRTRLAAVLTLAMINVFTLAAGITVVRMLPPRLAALRIPTVAAGRVDGAGHRVGRGTAAATLRHRERPAVGPGRRCPRPRSAPGVGGGGRPDHRAGAAVRGRDRPSTPARPPSSSPPSPPWRRSGANATFTTRVVYGAAPDRISSSVAAIPRSPCTSSRPRTTPLPPRWPASRRDGAGAEIAGPHDGDRRLRHVPFTGPALAPGWPQSYITTGNVTPIVSLRWTRGGAHGRAPQRLRRPLQPPPAHYRRRGHGVRLVRRPAGRGRHPRHRDPGGADRSRARASAIASVSSPPLSAIVDQSSRRATT